MSNSKNSFKACIDAIKIVVTSLKSFKKMNEQIDAQIKKAAAICINHGREFHDDTPMMRLINEIAIYDTVRAGNLRKFFEANAPVKFDLAEDKKSIENVHEVKDKDGNLKKAYVAEDVLDNLPIVPQKNITKTGGAKTNTPAPWSYKLCQDRILSLEQQLTKAVEPGGRGILGERNGKPVIMHNTDEGYRKFYDPYYQYIHGIVVTSKQLVPYNAPKTDTEEQVNTEAANDKLPKPKGQAKANGRSAPAEAKGRTKNNIHRKSKAA